MSTKIYKEFVMPEEKPPMDPNQLSDPENWVDQHGDYLFGYALLRLRDPRTAEDMVQETFLAALQARDNFAGRSSERTWLVGILKHKILNHLCRNSRERPISDVESPVDRMEEFFDDRGRLKATATEWATDPSRVFEQKEFWEVLQRCLSRLPVRLSEAFLLREMDELSSEEICNVLNVSVTNLRVMLHRARLRLRLCLELNWFGLKAENK